MANVFTHSTLTPRSTTLSDYQGHDATKCRIYPRALSPTRIANPHPRGLVYQVISHDKKSYGIWHPDLDRINRRMPKMLNHLQWVNFTCSPVVIAAKEAGKPPDVKYTENTTSRWNYKDPCRFPDLRINQKTTRYGFTPPRIPVKGIIPNLNLADYPPIPSDV